MFQIGDKVVHPMHGAGIVESIVQKKVNGVMRDYYVLKLPVRAMVVMIPTANSEEIGVRPIVDREQADLIRAAIHQAAAEGAVLTDDCAAVERLGMKVSLTRGSRENLKLTTPFDLVVGEAILDARERGEL